MSGICLISFNARLFFTFRETCLRTGIYLTCSEFACPRTIEFEDGFTNPRLNHFDPEQAFERPAASQRFAVEYDRLLLFVANRQADSLGDPLKKCFIQHDGIEFEQQISKRILARRLPFASERMPEFNWLQTKLLSSSGVPRKVAKLGTTIATSMELAAAGTQIPEVPCVSGSVILFLSLTQPARTSGNFTDAVLVSDPFR